eukprot:gnl/TRDRNA2_/TRDRNA2_34498_c0_seq1.p1 gnl/TRDRNA2_/TRDRNA2_34498_c0~~gnl/TRDRNA2_/TRDRNA2_34498_c0_seq1.p1  ORF type:complete len:356 (-),score=56.72 gnl/TRDRNA2_/TRDRNA2_34498_c0_seq1:434-1477(-)
MGVHDDVLFADPLGVRTPTAAKIARDRSETPPRRSSQQNRPRVPAQPQMHLLAADDDVDYTVPPAVEAQEEGWFSWLAPITSVLGGVGSQCCSMRAAADEEARKKASETGRPPQRRFPQPPDHDSPRPTPVGAAPKPTKAPVEPPRRPPARDESSDEDFAARRPPATSPVRPVPRFEVGQRVYRRGVPCIVQQVYSSIDPPTYLVEVRENGSSPRMVECEADQLSEVEPSNGRAAPAPSNVFAPEPPAESPPEASRKPPEVKWEWPVWALNFKKPCIEVWVDDDEGSGQWCPAEPQSRVVDKSGNDAYICAEYKWDDDYYVQDFGPQHVRKMGEKKTVFDICCQKAK